MRKKAEEHSLMNVRAFFHWQFSGVLFPLFYGAGLAFWSIGLSSEPFKLLFTTAALFLTLGFLWSAGWLATSDAVVIWRKRRSLSKPGAHFSIPYALALLLLSLPYLGTSAFLYQSYVAHAAEKELGSVQIFFGDDARQLAVEGAPFKPNASKSYLHEQLDKVPVREFFTPKEGVVDMSVIIRNTTGSPLRNAEVSIISNLPIEGKTDGMVSFSDKQVRSTSREWRPYKEEGVEEFQSIEFSAKADLTEARLIVIVSADNLKPFVGLGRFYFLHRGSTSTNLLFNVQPSK